jgi:hypothetical protein
MNRKPSSMNIAELEPRQMASATFGFEFFVSFPLAESSTHRLMSRCRTCIHWSTGQAKWPSVQVALLPCAVLHATRSSIRHHTNCSFNFHVLGCHDGWKLRSWETLITLSGTVPASQQLAAVHIFILSRRRDAPRMVRWTDAWTNMPCWLFELQHQQSNTEQWVWWEQMSNYLGPVYLRCGLCRKTVVQGKLLFWV